MSLPLCVDLNFVMTLLDVLETTCLIFSQNHLWQNMTSEDINVTLQQLVHIVDCFWGTMWIMSKLYATIINFTLIIKNYIPAFVLICSVSLWSFNGFHYSTEVKEKHTQIKNIYWTNGHWTMTIKQTDKGWTHQKWYSEFDDFLQLVDIKKQTKTNKNLNDKCYYEWNRKSLLCLM